MECRFNDPTKGMQERMYKHISENIHSLELDLINGIIRNRKPNQVNSNGYKQVRLAGKTIPQHQIFAVSLFGEKCIGKQVDHIDQNKLNNRSDNLRLVSHIENNKNIAGQRLEPFKAVHIDTGEQKIFETQNEAARQLKLPVSNINDVLKGRTKRSGRYTFCYFGAEE
jgi:hypothetical protein